MCNGVFFVTELNHTFKSKVQVRPGLATAAEFLSFFSPSGALIGAAQRKFFFFFLLAQAHHDDGIGQLAIQVRQSTVGCPNSTTIRFVMCCRALHREVIQKDEFDSDDRSTPKNGKYKYFRIP